MHNRMTSRPRDPGRPAGQTTPAQGETTTPHKVPRLPHERDLSADSQARGEASGKKLGKQAHKDLERGLVDTGKGPAMDRAYRRVKSGR
ncbi:MAG: hypothetical protein KA335_08150 [Ramlibacter sp.]|jgi:hypothetical protein|nr:hypothetical protein [Ramlibacter sp.]